ncbi:diguanylate cyclase [Clostridium oryzae]|uniref:Stage 0 sporulation protein A homolog n=1 Tax=Clostridium oryzae TaxID=1450648 RepID=A0A1V4I9E4_9CLOT|nr:diguanylate cyclase [Clostridium oryzae]OPJ56147.1 sensory/regulatory protein RpfC [Clostridium oryzae]
MTSVYKNNVKVLIYFLAIIFLTLSLSSCKKSTNNTLEASHGLMNLKKWDFNVNGNIRLDGKWEFYWNKLLSPQDFRTSSHKLTGYYKVPMYWTKYNTLHLPSQGKATYRIRIKTNDKLQNLSLKSPEIFTQYKIWINGRLIDEHGSLTKDIVKFLQPQVYSFANNKTTIEIVLQIKNHSDGNAGIGQSFILGRSDKIYRKRYLAIVMEMVLIGICCLEGIYHLILFLFRRNDKKLLFFGLFCLAIALRTMLTGETVIMEFFPNLSFNLVSRISTTSVTLCDITFIAFSYYQFKETISKLIAKILVAFNIAYMLIILLGSTYLYTFLFQYYFIIILTSAISIAYTSFKCAVKGSTSAIIFSIGLIFLCISGINDMLFYLQKVETGYYLCLGFVFFILAQSILLGIRFSNDYNVIKELSYKLQIVDRLKDDFLANTSHELRTPLNGIIGISESLIDGISGPLPNKAVQNLEIVVSSGKRLSLLIDNILDFSKLKNNDIMIRNQKIDFKQLVSVVVTVIQSNRIDNKVLIINEVPNNLPLVQGDENKLQQVMYNLIRNALKFTKAGYVRILAQEKNELIEVCIEDTGIGIAKNKIQNIFKSFEQSEDSIQTKLENISLDLSITQKIIELLGGNMRVESTLGKGSKFYFTLKPVSNNLPDKKPYELIDYSEDYMGSIGSMHKDPYFSAEEVQNNTYLRILAVDDETINLQVISNILKLRNYKVDTACDGVQALELIEKNSYDLILLDIMMPKMSGYDVCKKIRNNYTIYELPIIILTAKNQPDDISAAFQLGANDYLVKPFDKDELLARIKTQLSLKIAVKSALENSYLANIDSLTGLYNRRYLYALAKDAFLTAKSNNTALSAMILDIDFFKAFNDTYGHSIGDKVIKNVSSNIKEILKQKQIAGRYGGEEFVVILPDTNMNGARAFAENLRAIIENSKINVKQHNAIRCTVSIGVSSINSNIMSLKQLIDEADMMLYRAKENGRNRVEC